MSSRSSDDSSSSSSIDAGSPIPDFRAQGIQLQTIAPAMGIITPSHINNTPDYLDYDTKGRGIVVTMFANAGVSYLFGITLGGLYGCYSGIQSTPSSRFRVQLNSILNHSGRYGSRAGNTIGVFSVLYSLYEGLADQFDVDEMMNLRSVSPVAASAVAPALGATLASMTYFATSGPRVAALAGAIGFSSVATTYVAYSVLGIPYGSNGYLFF